MTLQFPPSYKSLTPFIKRAEELDSDASHPESRLVAFYCRRRALELGMEIHDKQKDTEGQKSLGQLLKKLEDEKKVIPRFSPEEGKKITTDFAMQIFDQADAEDQAGVATKSTAQAFYAAGVIMDVLQTFGPIDPEIENRRKYAKWRATEIVKAIKEGRMPAPGNSESENLHLHLAPQHEEQHVPDIPYSPQDFQNPAPTNSFAIPQVDPQYPPIQINSTVKPGTSGKKLDAAVYSDGIELLRFALCAVEYHEPELAIQRLQHALHILMQSR